MPEALLREAQATLPVGATPALDVAGVSRRFGKFTALEEVNLQLWPGEFTTIIGHSGCGKSTLLNMVAGLDAPSEGSLRLFGHPIEGPGADRAMVFQNYSLLPWLSVEANVAEALKAALPDLSPRERAARVAEVLSLVGLLAHARKRPGQLSGGQRQRVAIARAFAVRPRVLLLDEPFGALDAITKGKLQDELTGLWAGEHSGISNVIMVTHDIDEAIYLSDRIVVMSNGPRARVHEVITVDLPRPRERSQLAQDPTYAALKAHLIALLGVILAHDED